MSGRGAFGHLFSHRSSGDLSEWGASRDPASLSPAWGASRACLAWHWWVNKVFQFTMWTSSLKISFNLFSLCWEKPDSTHFHQWQWKHAIDKGIEFCYGISNFCRNWMPRKWWAPMWGTVGRTQWGVWTGKEGFCWSSSNPLGLLEWRSWQLELESTSDCLFYNNQGNNDMKALLQTQEGVRDPEGRPP